MNQYSWLLFLKFILSHLNFLEKGSVNQTLQSNSYSPKIHKKEKC